MGLLCFRVSQHELVPHAAEALDDPPLAPLASPDPAAAASPSPSTPAGLIDELKSKLEQRKVVDESGAEAVGAAQGAAAGGGAKGGAGGEAKGGEVKAGEAKGGAGGEAKGGEAKPGEAKAGEAKGGSEGGSSSRGHSRSGSQGSADLLQALGLAPGALDLVKDAGGSGGDEGGIGSGGSRDPVGAEAKEAKDAQEAKDKEAAATSGVENGGQDMEKDRGDKGSGSTTPPPPHSEAVGAEPASDSPAGAAEAVVDTRTAEQIEREKRRKVKQA